MALALRASPRPLLPPPLLVLLLARAAHAAVVARFSDAACTAPTGTTKIFGSKCYGSSMQHGGSAAGWVAYLGQAPIVTSYAVQSCAPGSMTVARWDTPAGAADFCLGTSTSSVTFALNVCTPDALGAGDTGGNFAVLVEDTCVTSDTFFVADMYYSGNCALSTYVFRATYMSSNAGFCELVEIPQFLDGSVAKRAVVNYSSLFGGGWKVDWYNANSAGCSPRSIEMSFTHIEIGACSQIYGGQGGVTRRRTTRRP